MHYIIDGYNLIFSIADTSGDLKTLRNKIINRLQRQFFLRKMKGTLVFDGAHRRGEESGLAYFSPLIIAYAPKGQSADDFILNEATKYDQVTIVTNDKGLRMHAKSLGADIQSNEDFLRWLYKHKKREKAIEPKDTKRNIERLLKIFEQKLEEEL